MGTLESIGSGLFVVGWIGFVVSSAWAVVVAWKTGRAPITQGRLVVSAMALTAAAFAFLFLAVPDAQQIRPEPFVVGAAVCFAVSGSPPGMGVQDACAMIARRQRPGGWRRQPRSGLRLGV